jgi:uncharacterized protein YaaR (DUF327 family)
MTELDLLVKQLDDKDEQLKSAVVVGNMDHIRGVQKVCGEIRGLLIAKWIRIRPQRQTGELG